MLDGHDEPRASSTSLVDFLGNSSAFDKLAVAEFPDPPARYSIDDIFSEDVYNAEHIAGFSHGEDQQLLAVGASSASPNGAKDRTTPRRWNVDEDQRLRAAVQMHGARNWRGISMLVRGRSAVQCSQRYLKVLAPGIKKGYWTDDEDATLKRLKAGHHALTWSEIATQIPTRTSKQCRERWSRIDPALDRSPFTLAEDQLLVAEFQRVGSRWTQIARALAARGVRREPKALRLRHGAITDGLVQMQGQGQAIMPPLRHCGGISTAEPGLSPVRPTPASTPQTISPLSVTKNPYLNDGHIRVAIAQKDQPASAVARSLPSSWAYVSPASTEPCASLVLSSTAPLPLSVEEIAPRPTPSDANGGFDHRSNRTIISRSSGSSSHSSSSGHSSGSGSSSSSEHNTFQFVTMLLDEADEATTANSAGDDNADLADILSDCELLEDDSIDACLAGDSVDGVHMPFVALQQSDSFDESDAMMFKVLDAVQEAQPLPSQSQLQLQPKTQQQ